MKFNGLLLVVVSYCLTVAGNGQQLIQIDVASLHDRAVAARALPPLARQLLGERIPDPETRMELLIVAGDLQGARELMLGFDMLDAARIEEALANRDPFGTWSDALQIFSGKKALSVNDAIALVEAYAPEAPGAPEIIAEDSRRRFSVQRATVAGYGGVKLAAIVVRARNAAPRQPAALLYTIYAQPYVDTLRAEYGAARGYASVIAYARGKAWGTGQIAPYEFDGRDADHVISWIADQPWSDGKVGMYGGSYNGFTQWAAAKYHNRALKTIVPYVANNPGNGLPMENNIFLLVNYAWIYYVTGNHYLDDKAYDAPGLGTLNDRWFASGRSYRDVPAVYGRPNPWLQKWLDHPTFDSYWQSMVPYRTDFAQINIPVLTVTGYYDDGQGSALNFLKDHQAYNSRAIDYLVIGPYDHLGSQHAHKDDVLRGYAIDAVAQYSTPQLTFDWFDWILRGKTRPAMLRDRVNFEVMGANVWRHASSVATMAGRQRRYYLAPGSLSATPAQRRSLMVETANFADRKTVNGNDYYPFPISGAKPDLSRGLVFVTPPLRKAMEIDGFFTANLNAIINKRDVDVEAVLYQVLPDGKLMHLSYFMGRASYDNDAIVRHFFVPGKVRTIAFDRSRLVSRYVEPGSRLMLTLDVVKNSFAEINYGTGGDVSRESIADAKTPLVVQWSTDSYITLPVR